VLAAVALFMPALLLLVLIVVLFGPDAKVSYDREYEEQPPTDTPPALVPPLLRRANTPESNEFTATLFDLIRRGYYSAEPVAADEPTGGDLELRPGDRYVALQPFEKPVAGVFDAILADGPVRVSELHARVGASSVDGFDRFKEGAREAIESRGWYTFTAARVLLLTSLGLFAIGMIGAWLLYSSSKSAAFYYGATTIDGAAVLFHASWIAKLVRRRRRTAAGQLEARRWEAFRSYLSDFPRLGETPAPALELWNELLVYAIAFGLADRVLASAALYRLDMLSGSPIVWLGLQRAETTDVYTRLGSDILPSRGHRL